MSSTIFVSIQNPYKLKNIPYVYIHKDLDVNIVIRFLFVCTSHFLGEKLQYLESLKDTLIKFMENISCVYYKCSLSIAKLLPQDALSEELFTKFERNSFEISGEINYQVLKVNNAFSKYIHFMIIFIV